MDRRGFMAAIGACASVATLRAGAQDAGVSAPAAMRTRAVPASGEHLPVIGMGTSGSFDVGPGPEDRAPLVEVTSLLMQTPNSVIDTAPSYGRAEAVTGTIVHDGGWRERTFLATKISAAAGEAARAQWRQSLAHLQTDRVDLLQVHNLVDWRENLAYLRALKEAGQVRYVGVTHYLDSAHEALLGIVEAEPVDFVQVNYSVVDRAAERGLLPACQERGVAVVINRAFEDGRLFSAVRGRPVPDWAAEIDCESWAQLFLKFVVSHPAVTVVIPATSKPKNMRDNLRAGVGVLPDAGQRERIAALLA